MRLLIAMMKARTNTFSRCRPIGALRTRPRPGCTRGGGERVSRTGSGLGAYLDSRRAGEGRDRLADCRRRAASRPVDDEAFEHMASVICEAVEKAGHDGIMLDLHGAMVTEKPRRRRGRAVASHRAIDPTDADRVSLDMTPTSTMSIPRSPTIVTRLPTLPAYRHLRQRQTRRRILLKAMRGEISPVMAWAPSDAGSQYAGRLYDSTRNCNEARCAAMSAQGPEGGRAGGEPLPTGFPHADISNAGLWASFVTDGDRGLAERLARRIIGIRRGRIAKPSSTGSSGRSIPGAAKACRRNAWRGADRAARHYDNCGLRADDWTRRSNLARSCARGLDNVRGLRVSTTPRRCSGRSPLASARQSAVDRGKMKNAGDPRQPAAERIGTVRRSPRAASAQGAVGARRPMDMGPSVVIDTQGRDRAGSHASRAERSELPCLSLGIDPMQKRYVMLRAASIGRRARALAKSVVDCAGIGVCTSDYSQLNFTQGAAADLSARPANR